MHVAHVGVGAGALGLVLEHDLEEALRLIPPLLCRCLDPCKPKQLSSGALSSCSGILAQRLSYLAYSSQALVLAPRPSLLCRRLNPCETKKLLASGVFGALCEIVQLTAASLSAVWKKRFATFHRCSFAACQRIPFRSGLCCCNNTYPAWPGKAQQLCRVYLEVWR